jgi:uncharacterized protein
MTALIAAEVVYALPLRQSATVLEVAEGATVRDVLRLSGVFEAHPELKVERCEVAIWGRIVDLDSPVRDGDRLELCRPLIADPKSARRQRAGRKPR